MSFRFPVYSSAFNLPLESRAASKLFETTDLHYPLSGRVARNERGGLIVTPDKALVRTVQPNSPSEDHEVEIEVVCTSNLKVSNNNFTCGGARSA